MFETANDEEKKTIHSSLGNSPPGLKPLNQSPPRAADPTMPPSDRKRSSESSEDLLSPSEEAASNEENIAPAVETAGQDENASASPAKRARTSTSSQPSSSSRSREQAGLIHKVEVINFMCHPHLTVPFHRNINFIHGQNGSGKSAILAAIQICLGAGARRTHRARNLQELIRKAAPNERQPQKAQVSVSLTNEGQDAFEHETYGDRITVERHIAKSGSGFNGYKLLDQDGKERSRSKDDLVKLLDHLNITVDNPVSILDQEDAKKFITGKSQDKYNFFLKATDLERLDNSYAQTINDIEEMETNCNRKQDSLSVQQEHVKNLKARYEKFKKVEQLEEKLETLKVKYTWSKYIELNDNLEQAIQDCNKFREKAKAKEAELTQAEELAQVDTQERESRESVISKLTKEAEEQSLLKSQLQKELQQKLLPFKQAERAVQAKQREQQEAEKDLKSSQLRLKKAREEIVRQNHNSDRARKTERIRELEEELKRQKSEDDDLKKKTNDLFAKFDEMTPQVQQAKKDVNDMERRLYATSKSLEELESSQDSLAKFGPRVSALCRKVEGARSQFKGPVVGPIGTYIGIANGKEKFATLAEFGLGQVADRFIVTNDHDRNLLMTLRRQVNCHKDCNVFQMANKKRYNIPAPPGVQDIETVASVLNITDDLVFNCLVDQQKIDRTILASSIEHSQNHLLTENSGGHAIKGPYLEVICGPNGDKWSVRGGHLNIFSNEKKARRWIGADKTAAIAAAKDEIEQLEADLELRKKEENRLEHHHSKLQREWNGSKKQYRQLTDHIRELGEEIETIKSELENASDDTTDTSDLEAAVSRDEERIEEIKREWKELSDKCQQGSPEINELRRKCNEAETRAKKVIDDLALAQEALTQILETQTQLEDKLQKKREKIAKFNDIISKHESSIATLKQEADDAMGKAKLLHWRLDRRTNGIGETPSSQDSNDAGSINPTTDELDAIEVPKLEKGAAYYAKKIEAATKSINDERKKRKIGDETQKEAQANYQQALSDFQNKAKSLEQERESIARLEKDVQERQTRWKHMRHYLEKKTDQKFRELLRVNKYSGSLAFDHECSDMEIAVQKDDSSAGVTKDVKALRYVELPCCLFVSAVWIRLSHVYFSGGERSFTTISLLLALGEQIETPFRIMDEFDVFLDNATRKLVLTKLIHLAKTMKNRQFVFITPQDLSGIKEDPMVRITQLRPPERYQNAADLVQQRLSFSQTSQ